MARGGAAAEARLPRTAPHPTLGLSVVPTAECDSRPDRFHGVAIQLLRVQLGRQSVIGHTTIISEQTGAMMVWPGVVTRLEVMWCAPAAGVPVDSINTYASEVRVLEAKVLAEQQTVLQVRHLCARSLNSFMIF